MNKEKAIQLAKAAFAAHRVDVVFVTENETIFFAEDQAKIYASGIKSNVVIPVTRAEAEGGTTLVIDTDAAQKEALKGSLKAIVKEVLLELLDEWEETGLKKPEKPVEDDKKEAETPTPPADAPEPPAPVEETPNTPAPAVDEKKSEQEN